MEQVQSVDSEHYSCIAVRDISVVSVSIFSATMAYLQCCHTPLFLRVTGMKMLTPFLVMLVVSSRTIWGYPNGAPLSACDSLIPNHGAEEQKTSPPYAFTYNQERGNMYRVTLAGRSTEDFFRGFLLQAYMGKWSDCSRGDPLRCK